MTLVLVVVCFAIANAIIDQTQFNALSGFIQTLGMNKRKEMYICPIGEWFVRLFSLRATGPVLGERRL